MGSDKDDDTSHMQSKLVGHHFATIHVGDGCRVQYHRCQGSSAHAIVLHPLVLNWFNKDTANRKSQFHEAETIKVYCEYKRERTHYWAHPNYCQLGPWHDWVMVMYDAGDDTASVDSEVVKNAFPFHHDENPSKIMCFFVMDEEDEVNALVHSCQTSDHSNDSTLFKRWTKEYIGRVQYFEPMLRVVPVDAFGSRVLVVEDNHSILETVPKQQLKAGITLVTPRESHWPQQFLSADIRED